IHDESLPEADLQIPGDHRQHDGQKAELEQDGVEDADDLGLLGGAAEMMDHMVKAKVVDIVPEHGDGGAGGHANNAVAGSTLEGEGSQRGGQQNADELEGNSVANTVGGGAHGKCSMFSGPSRGMLPTMGEVVLAC